MYDVAGIFIQGHMPVIGNLCIPVFLVNLLIVVSSYDVCILTCLSYICIAWETA